MKTSERLRKQINDDKFPGAGFVVLSLEMLKKSKGAKVIVALRMNRILYSLCVICAASFPTLQPWHHHWHLEELSQKD